jgi:hypothetical protein
MRRKMLCRVEDVREGDILTILDIPYVVERSAPGMRRPAPGGALVPVHVLRLHLPKGHGWLAFSQIPGEYVPVAREAEDDWRVERLEDVRVGEAVRQGQGFPWFVVHRIRQWSSPEGPRVCVEEGHERGRPQILGRASFEVQVRIED